MRLFIAVEIPGDIRKKLASLQAKIGDIGKVKWVEEENIHITMKFLGDVDDGKVGEINDSLETVKHDTFKCEVKGFGTFPNEDYIKVMWAGIEPESQFKILSDKIEKTLEPIGFKKESRFHPHATIGRVRLVKDKEKLKASIVELKTEIFGEFELNQFKLRKSTLTPKGPVHEDVSVFSL